MPKNKAKDRQGVVEKTEGTISRRSVLKIGAAAGAAGVLAPNMGPWLLAQFHPRLTKTT